MYRRRCPGVAWPAAERLGWSASVEQLDARGVGPQLSAAQIAEADWILVVSRGFVDLARFAGKRLFQARPAQEATADALAFLQRAEREATPYVAPVPAAC